jgi:hypothetical protein
MLPYNKIIYPNSIPQNGSDSNRKREKRTVFSGKFCTICGNERKNFHFESEKARLFNAFFVILKFFKKNLQNFEKPLAIWNDIVYNIDVRNRIQRFVPAKGRYWS